MVKESGREDQSLPRITNWSFLMKEMREQALQRDLVCSGVEGSGSWIGKERQICRWLKG